MNLKPLIMFLTGTRAGRFATLADLGVLSIVFVRSCRPESAPHDTGKSLPGVSVGELTRSVASFPSRLPRTESPVKTNAVPPVLAPIRWSGTNAGSSTLAQSRLPSRRLLPCRLVNTVDSFSPETPIIGLITGDVFFFGQRIIPKGTEVHARAQAGRFRDRIASQGSWTLIWPSGEELAGSGLALDLDQDGDKWGITDGSHGLRGTPQKAGAYEETKLFFASFLSGLTEPFKERPATPYGFQLAPTAQNAALSGVGEVVETYAKRLLLNLEQESVFSCVPAGKTFYRYTLESIQPPTASLTPVQP